MQKGLTNILIIVLTVFMAGCGSLRRGKTAVTADEAAGAGYSAIIAGVLENNITDNGFEIRKGSIELEGTEIEGKFGLNARLNRKGDFYCSVRGPLGIELVRLLMVGNDIAAIDRFNRIVYIGKKDAVLRKNGMPEDFMKIVFGDIPDEVNMILSTNRNSEIRLSAGNDDFRREITVCVNDMKVCSQMIDASASDHELYLTFDNFAVAGGKKYASLITMEEKVKMFHVKLFIDDLIYGYDNDIEFNLPSYKRESF